MSKELLLSAAFIVKHVKAALHSTGGRFGADMGLALGRALDCETWLLLLKGGEWMSIAEYESLTHDCIELIKLTSSISRTSTRDNG